MTVVPTDVYKRILFLAEEQELPPDKIAEITGVPLAEVRRIVYTEAPKELEASIQQLLASGERSPRPATQALAARARRVLEELLAELAEERRLNALRLRKAHLLAELNDTNQQLRTARKAKSTNGNGE